MSHISLEVTSECNLNCRYCYNYWKSPYFKENKEFNSFAKAKKALKKLFKTANVDYVTFTGGEPFLAERFNELVLYAKLKGKSVTIITNGSAASEDDYKLLSKLRVDLFEIPVHSAQANVHDFLTGVKGSWAKSVNSIKFLLSINVKVVAVIVITKQNFQKIGETLKFIKNIGINRVMLNRFNIGGKGISEKVNLELTKNELNYAFKMASQTGKDLEISLSSNVCTPLCIVNPTDFNNILFTKCPANIIERPLTVDIEGNFRFCNHSPTVLGNIFTDKFEDMFESEKAKQWGDTVPDYCNSCNLYSSCMAGCRAASEQLNLSLDSPDPIVIKEFSV